MGIDEKRTQQNVEEKSYEKKTGTGKEETFF